MDDLPILYKKTRTGATQQWKVFTEAEEIIVEQGQVDGKKQQYRTTCTPKNVGKSNESTGASQAILEAEAKWRKQLKKGYVEDPEGEVLIRSPMKVHEYPKHKKKVIFPCDISPKLNGLNGEFRWLEEGSKFLSRGGEDYPVPHTEAVSELIDLCTLLGEDHLNYEIYKHGEWLQDISSAVNDPSGEIGKQLHSRLEYHIFDIPTNKTKWQERKAKLEAIMGMDEYLNFRYVRLVPWEPCNDEQDLERICQKHRDQKYEGSVIRNNKGLYEYNTRSHDVLKYKIPVSEEFKVLSWTVDKNNQPVFVCMARGGEFKVKPVGDRSHRENIRLNADDWVGKYMTVDFEMYSKGGKPQKPVGIGLRKGYVDKLGNFVPTE